MLNVNPHAFGHCVIFSGKKVTAPPPPRKSEGAHTHKKIMAKFALDLCLCFYRNQKHESKLKLEQASFNVYFNGGE